MAIVMRSRWLALNCKRCFVSIVSIGWTRTIQYCRQRIHLRVGETEHNHTACPVTSLNDSSKSQVISASTVTDLPGMLLAAGTYKLDVRVSDIHYAYTDVPSIQPIQVAF